MDLKCWGSAGVGEILLLKYVSPSCQFHLHFSHIILAAFLIVIRQTIYCVHNSTTSTVEPSVLLSIKLMIRHADWCTHAMGLHLFL